MRILIISDIHGAYFNLIEILNKERFDKLIVLGDIMPYGHYYSNSDEDILELLSKYKNKLILIEGNCDRYLNYEAYNLKPIKEITVHLNNRLVTLTHSHLHNTIPDYHGKIYISGHTHIPSLKVQNGIIYANPGSISLPRNGSEISYMIFDNNKLVIKNFNNKVLKELNI